MLTCPKCEERTHVIDSRLNSQGIRRRRRCTECNYRFTTIEVIRTVESDNEDDWLKGFVQNWR